MTPEFETTEETPTTPVSHTAIPSLKETYTKGFALYKENAKTLMQSGGLILVVYAVFVMLIGVIAITVVATTHGLGAALIALGVLLGIFAVAAFLWFYFWAFLTMQYVIAHSDQKPTIKDALAATRSLIIPFAWVAILQALVMLVPVFVTVLIIGLVFLLHVEALTAIVAVIGVIAIFVFLCIFGAWFIFTNWVFLLNGARGVDALKQSREIFRDDFSSKFWLVIGAGVLYGIAIWILSLVLVFVFSAAFGSTYGADISQVLLTVSEMLFFTPFILCCYFSIFQSLKKA